MCTVYSISHSALGPQVRVGHLCSSVFLTRPIVGPIIGGQFYDNLSHGFMFSYVFLIAVFGFCAVMTFFYAGDVSVASQLYHYRANKLERREGEV